LPVAFVWTKNRLASEKRELVETDATDKPFISWGVAQCLCAQLPRQCREAKAKKHRGVASAMIATLKMYVYRRRPDIDPWR
jgi:hypothetical protein